MKSNISSPETYSYLSTLPDDNADIFAVSLLILYYSFSSLILLWIVMISFYIIPTRLLLKCSILSEEKVVWFTKEEYGFNREFFQNIY